MPEALPETRDDKNPHIFLVGDLTGFNFVLLVSLKLLSTFSELLTSVSVMKKDKLSGVILFSICFFLERKCSFCNQPSMLVLVAECSSKYYT